MSSSKYVGQAKDFGGAQLQNIGDASANNHAASWGEHQFRTSPLVSAPRRPLT